MSRIGIWKGFCCSILQQLKQISFSAAAVSNDRFSRTWPRTQKSLSGTGRNSGGRFFLWREQGLLTLLWEKKQQLSNTATSAIWRPEFLSRLSAHWWHSIQSELRHVPPLIAECSRGPSDHLPCVVPLAYKSGTGFLPMVISTTLLLMKTPFQRTTVIQEAFSHHDVAFTSTPVLFHTDSAQPFIVLSESSSQIAEMISSQGTNLLHKYAFRFFS